MPWSEEFDAVIRELQAAPEPNAEQCNHFLRLLTNASFAIARNLASGNLSKLSAHATSSIVTLCDIHGRLSYEKAWQTSAKFNLNRFLQLLKPHVVGYMPLNFPTALDAIPGSPTSSPGGSLAREFSPRRQALAHSPGRLNIHTATVSPARDCPSPIAPTPPRPAASMADQAGAGAGAGAGASGDSFRTPTRPSITTQATTPTTPFAVPAASVSTVNDLRISVGTLATQLTAYGYSEDLNPQLLQLQADVNAVLLTDSKPTSKLHFSTVFNALCTIHSRLPDSADAPISRQVKLAINRALNSLKSVLPRHQQHLIPKPITEDSPPSLRTPSSLATPPSPIASPTRKRRDDLIRSAQQLTRALLAKLEGRGSRRDSVDELARKLNTEILELQKLAGSYSENTDPLTPHHVSAFFRENSASLADIQRLLSQQTRKSGEMVQLLSTLISCPISWSPIVAPRQLEEPEMPSPETLLAADPVAYLSSKAQLCLGTLRGISATPALRVTGIQELILMLELQLKKNDTDILTEAMQGCFKTLCQIDTELKNDTSALSQGLYEQLNALLLRLQPYAPAETAAPARAMRSTSALMAAGLRSPDGPSPMLPLAWRGRHRRGDESSSDEDDAPPPIVAASSASESSSARRIRSATPRPAAVLHGPSSIWNLPIPGDAADREALDRLPHTAPGRRRRRRDRSRSPGRQ